LKSKIDELECALDKIAIGSNPSNESEAFSWVGTAKDIARYI
jgi:hypothetical protein